MAELESVENMFLFRALSPDATSAQNGGKICAQQIAREV
jgi:hypothetical protein